MSTVVPTFPREPLPPALAHPVRCRRCDRGLTSRRTGSPRPSDHYGRGLCRTCYGRALKAGVLGDYPKTSNDPAYYVPARARTGSFGGFELRTTHLVTGTILPANEANERRAAALTVCRLAGDATAATEVLLALGLIHPATA